LAPLAFRLAGHFCVRPSFCGPSFCDADPLPKCDPDHGSRTRDGI